MRSIETEWWRLGEEIRGAETVSRGLQGTLRIRRLQRSFREAHDGPAPPPSWGP